MSTILLRLKTWWETADKTQKVVTLGGITFLVLMLGGIFVYASTPKYAMLYAGLSDADKNVVVTEIQTMGVPVKYDSPGTVEVPANRIQDVRMRLAGTGKAPKATAYSGIAELDKINLMTTPAQERERLKSALEGEIAKSIETLDGVQAVRVHITLPDPRALASNNRPPTAAVSITESPGKSLMPGQGRAIASLVANSCESMDIRNVTVLNQRMEFIFNGQDSESNQMAAVTKQALEDKVAKERQEEIQRNLDRVFGPGMTVVTVRAELDMDKTSKEINAEALTEGKPAVTASTTETMPIVAGSNAAVPGLNSNNPGAPAAKPAGAGGPNSAGDYKAETKALTVPMTVTKTKTDQATGSLKSLTINVIANSAASADGSPAPANGASGPVNVLSTPDGQTSLIQILKGEVSALQKRDPAAFPDPTVTFVEFDATANAKAAAAQAAMEGQQTRQQIISMLPIAALILVGIVVMKQVSKMGKASSALLAQTNLESELATSTSAGARLATESPILEDTPEFESAPEITAAMAQAQEKIAAAPLALPDLMVDPIPDKVSVPLEQIKKMARERPEMVATLMKSMILEEKR